MIYKFFTLLVFAAFCMPAPAQINDSDLKMEHKIQNTVNASIEINAPAAKVWAVLTDPARIKIFIGSTITTDWKTGSPVTWTGEMNGVHYENKGRILEYIPNQKLRHTYWSGMGGDADSSENYSEVTYTINPKSANAIELTYDRTKIPTQMETVIFQSHIPSVLEEIKRLAEE